MSSPQPVRIGEPLPEFPGGSFNALVADYHARRGERGKDGPARPGGSSPALPVLVKNSSGAAREPGDVLGITGVVFTTAQDGKQFYRAPVLNGITPVLADHANAFVVCKNHIANGKIGPAWLLGCDWVKVDVTDAAHKFAKVKNAATYLESGTDGFAIVFKEKQAQSGSAALGQQWALVLLGGGGAGGSNKTAIVKATAIIDAAVDSGGTRTPESSSDFDLIAGDSFSTINNWSLVTIPDESYMVVVEIEGDMVITAVFC